MGTDDADTGDLEPTRWGPIKKSDAVHPWVAVGDESASEWWLRREFDGGVAIVRADTLTTCSARGETTSGRQFRGQPVKEIARALADADAWIAEMTASAPTHADAGSEEGATDSSLPPSPR
ncbi:hypothetical protein [Nocardia sp. NPDC050710]|uniref:hypothetical protein n=1 Tax=Nocardia sp. NPDC050710 TaxID=3157220 RepID=UPI00340AE149